MVNHDTDFDRVMRRLAESLKAGTDADIARALHLATSDYAQRKKRGKIPWDRIVSAARERSISLDWIVSGQAQASAAKAPVQGTYRQGEDRPERPADIEDSGAGIDRLGKFVCWAFGWWSNATAAERIWADIQLQRAFPEYAAQAAEASDAGSSSAGDTGRGEAKKE